MRTPTYILGASTHTLLSCIVARQRTTSPFGMWRQVYMITMGFGQNIWTKVSFASLEPDRQHP